jgi:hypothetical protein
MEDDQVVMAYRAHIPDDPSATTVTESFLDWLDGMVEMFSEENADSGRVAGPRKSGRDIFLSDDLVLDLDDECLLEPLGLADLKQADKNNIMKAGHSDKTGASWVTSDMIEKIGLPKIEHAHVAEDGFSSDDGSPKKKRRV